MKFIECVKLAVGAAIFLLYIAGIAAMTGLLFQAG